jgi:hypothetical protein
MRQLVWTIVLGSCLAAAAVPSPIPWRAYQGPDVGGRELALSGSVAAIGDDAALAFWNPAAIAGMKWSMASAGYVHSAGMLADPLFSGPKRLTYLAVTGPQGGFTWRSLARFKEETAAATGADTVFRYLKYAADEFTLAFASRDESYAGLSLGIAAKLLWARLTEQEQTLSSGSLGRACLRDENGVGYGLDAGLLWEAKPVRLFANFQNLLAKVYFREFDDDKPKIRASGGIGWVKEGTPSVSVGAEKYLFKGSPRLRYNAAAEYKRSIENYGAITGRAGYAAWYKGSGDDYSWSWGLGYVYGKFLVDAASINQKDPLSGAWRSTYAASVSLYLN